jgi:membrane protein
MTKLYRYLINSFPYRYASTKSKSIYPPGFQGLPLYDVTVFFRSQVQKVGLRDRARSIAFSFLLAIPAATIFLCTLIPYLPVSKKLTNQLLLLTKEITPNQNSYLLVRNFLIDFLTKPRGGLLSLGLIISLYYASDAMIGLMRSFNKSLSPHSHFPRNFLHNRLVAIQLTLVLMLLVIGSIVILVTQDALLIYLFKAFHIQNRSMRGVFKTLRWFVIIPLFYFAIAYIYRHAPSIKEKWKLFSPGTLLATVLMILVTFIFSFWVNNFGTYNKVYGSIGTILILMVVVYFNALILLIGFELNVSIHSLQEKVKLRKYIKK